VNHPSTPLATFKGFDMSIDQRHRSQKLALWIAKFVDNSETHEEAEAMAEHARARDRALELEAAEYGLEFDLIVREAMRTSEAFEAGQRL
jgi:hypothetical protein